MTDVTQNPTGIFDKMLLARSLASFQFHSLIADRVEMV